MRNALDLYAKIEPLIGFYDDYERLYQIYLKTILPLKPKSVLDFGCGNGRLLELLGKNHITALGVDKSGAMIDRARSRGVNALCCDLADLAQKFDMVIAAADVLNYFDEKELLKITRLIADKLETGGIFIADINTLHGFKNVAEGVLIQKSGDMFLGVEAEFEGKKLVTIFTLFEKQNSGFTREEASITQYFHALSFFKKLPELSLLKTQKISLFDEKTADKTLLIFKKIA